jgi:nitrite reductase/ring-hydroxylating ferredoxin subunit
MSDEPCRRRRFLEVVAQGGVLAGAAGLGIGCGGGLSGSYAAGNVSQLEVGQLVAVSGAPLAVGRDAGGVWAMSLVCTHEGCDGSVEAGGVFCACHGSRFDVQGNPPAGPARAPLQHYHVTVDASGALTVNTDAPVPESVRTAVTGQTKATSGPATSARSRSRSQKSGAGTGAGAGRVAVLEMARV